MDHICIQESNLNCSSSFWIPEFSALRSDCTHSRTSIFSPNDPLTNSGVIIFVRQGFSFPKFSTSSLSSLDYVGVNISLNNSSPVSFLKVYAPLIQSSSTYSRTHSFSPSISFFSKIFFILWDFNCHHPHWDSEGTSDSCGEEVFNWVISSSFLPLNDFDMPILLHHFSGSCSSLDIFFAPFSLALCCSLEVL